MSNNVESTTQGAKAVSDNPYDHLWISPEALEELRNWSSPEQAKEYFIEAKLIEADKPNANGDIFSSGLNHTLPVNENYTEHVWHFGSPNFYCTDPAKRKELYENWYQEQLAKHSKDLKQKGNCP